MNALRILILIAAVMACDTSAQTNNADVNSQAARRRALLGTNTFQRPLPPGPSQPAIVAPTNAPVAEAAAAEATALTNAVPPLVGPPPVAPGNFTPAVTRPATNNAVPAVPGAQVPTRAPINFPQLPTPGASQAPAPGTTAAAPAADPGEIPEGGIDLKGAPLDQVFDLYQSYSGRTVLRPYTLPAQGITIYSATPLTQKEAIQALDSVLALNGIVMINMGERFVKAVPAAQADKEGAPIDKGTAEDLPESEQFVTKVVTLKTAKPTEVAQVITAFGKSPTSVTPIDSNMTLVLRDYASNIKRMMELIEKIDVLPEKDFKLEVVPIRYGKVGEIYATMSALISGGGSGAGAGGFSATGVGGRSTGMGMGGYGMGGMGGMNRGRMGGGYGGSSYGGYNRGYGGGYGSQYGGQYGGGTIYPQQVAQPSAAGAQSSFQNRLNQIVNRATQPEEQRILEAANIVPDERSNKLLIFANKRDMEMITNIVSKVDVLLAQVLIEAVILEVSLGDTLNYGVSAAQRAKQFTPDFQGAGAFNNGQAFFNTLTNFPAGSPSGFSYFGKFGQTFDIAIQAIATDRKANVISRPRIQTSHAITGFIFVGETRPYVTGFSDYSFGSSLSTRSTVQERTIGLTLSVTPFITPDGLVVMELSQQFDAYKGDVTVEGNPYPLVDSRMAESMLTVRDGDLIMLGGFITDSRSKSKSGVPLLKDIPGIGALFRSTTQNSQRTELIILMKATVLESPEQAAFVAAQERSTLPGIREAEINQQDADQKRAKELQRKEQRRQLKGF